MTYSLGLEPVESTPESARWYKLTPGVIAELRASYPQDAAIRDMIARVGASPVFMGVAPDDLYWMSATSQGNIGGAYKAPAGPVMTYAQVLRVFEITVGGPDTKPVFQRNAVVPRRSKTALYVGIGVGVAALLGVAYLATRKKQAAAALVANRRRRLRRNPPLAFTPEMYALHAQIESEKRAKDAPRKVSWTPMRLNRRSAR